MAAAVPLFWSELQALGSWLLQILLKNMKDNSKTTKNNFRKLADQEIMSSTPERSIP